MELRPPVDTGDVHPRCDHIDLKPERGGEAPGRVDVDLDTHLEAAPSHGGIEMGPGATQPRHVRLTGLIETVDIGAVGEQEMSVAGDDVPEVHTGIGIDVEGETAVLVE